MGDTGPIHVCPDPLFPCAWKGAGDETKVLLASIITSLMHTYMLFSQLRSTLLSSSGSKTHHHTHCRPYNINVTLIYYVKLFWYPSLSIVMKLTWKSRPIVAQHPFRVISWSTRVSIAGRCSHLWYVFHLSDTAYLAQQQTANSSGEEECLCWRWWWYFLCMCKATCTGEVADTFLLLGGWSISSMSNFSWTHV